MKKKISMLLAVTMLFTSISVNNSIASNSNYLEELMKKENILIIGDDILEFKDKSEIRERVAGEVLVFVAGILMGYIVDGAIIYATGKSGGAWVAEALEYFEKNPNVEKIYLDNDSSGSGYDCSVYPPNSPQGCKP